MSSSRFETINMLIQNYRDENQPVYDEWQITKAILTDNPSLLSSILKKERDLDRLKRIKTFEQNLDILSTSAKHCKKEICKILVDYYNYEVNTVSNDGTPLHWLVKSNIINIEETVNYSKLLNKETSRYYSFKEIYKLFILKKCDVNAQDSHGLTPLHYAALKDNYGAAYVLLENKNVRKDIRDRDGMMPLHIACKYGNENVALLLLNFLKEEVIRISDHINKMTALHYVCNFKIEKPILFERIYEKIKSNENRKAFLMKKDKNGNIALHLAIRENHLKIIEFILLKTNNLCKYIKDRELNMPIHLCVKYGKEDMFQLFEKYNLIVFDTNDDWNNIFHLAALENKWSILKHLFEYVENKNVQFQQQQQQQQLQQQQASNQLNSNIQASARHGVSHLDISNVTSSTSTTPVDELNFALSAINRLNFTPLLCSIIKGNIRCLEIFLHENLKLLNAKYDYYSYIEATKKQNDDDKSSDNQPTLNVALVQTPPKLVDLISIEMFELCIEFDQKKVFKYLMDILLFDDSAQNERKSKKSKKKESTLNEDQEQEQTNDEEDARSVDQLDLEKYYFFISEKNLTNLNHNTILHLACIYKNSYLVKLLVNLILNHKLSYELLFMKNKYNETCFHLACKHNSLDIVEYLLKIKETNFVHNYKPLDEYDQNLMTPFHVATKMNNKRLIDLLVRYDDNDLKKYMCLDKFQKSIFHYGCENGSYEIVKRFTETIINKTINSNNNSNANYLDIFQVDVHSNDHNSDYISHTYYSNKLKNKLNQTSPNNIFLVNLLGVRDAKNYTALDYACLHGHNELVKHLLDNGAGVNDIVNEKNKHVNCLDLAIDNNHTPVVETLLNDKNYKKFLNFQYAGMGWTKAQMGEDDEPELNIQRTVTLQSIASANSNTARRMPAKKKGNKKGYSQAQKGSRSASRDRDDNASDSFFGSSLSSSDSDSSEEMSVSVVKAPEKNIANEVFSKNRQLRPKVINKETKIKKLIIKMPFMMKVLLDRCFDTKTHKFDFELIDSPYYHPTENHPLWVMALHQYKYLLGHAAVQNVLALKMRIWPRLIFWTNLFFYLAFLSLSSFVHVNEAIWRTNKSTFDLGLDSLERSFAAARNISFFAPRAPSEREHQNDFSQHDTASMDMFHSITRRDVSNITNLAMPLSNQTSQLSSVDEKLITFHVWPLPVEFSLPDFQGKMFYIFVKAIVHVLLTILLSKKLFQLFKYGLKIFGNIENWFESFSFIFYVTSQFQIDGTSPAFGSLSVLFGWISFAFFFQSIGLFKIGSYSLALRKTIQNSFKFIPFFIFIYFGFLCSYKIREGYGITYYNNTVSHVIRTITMMVGELQTSEMGIEGFDGNWFNFLTNNLIYICFVFIMCIIVLDSFIGIEVGEIKTVIDEAETQNTAMNIIFVMRVQEVLYKLVHFFRHMCCCRCMKCFKPKKSRLMSWQRACRHHIYSFMNTREHLIPRIDVLLKPEKRPDLLNRVENYLVVMSHSFDQQLFEQLKLLKDLKDQFYTVNYQIEILKAKLHHVESLDEHNRKNLKKSQQLAENAKASAAPRKKSLKTPSTCADYDVKYYLSQDKQERSQPSSSTLMPSESTQEIVKLIYL